jgi:hypothetical protein
MQIVMCAMLQSVNAFRARTRSTSITKVFVQAVAVTISSATVGSVHIIDNVLSGVAVMKVQLVQKGIWLQTWPQQTAFSNLSHIRIASIDQLIGRMIEHCQHECPSEG